MLSNALRLARVARIDSTLYRIGLYRQRWVLRSLLPARPVVRDEECAKPGESEVGAVLWSGGSVKKVAAAENVTERLPVLMYHRVSPTGSAKLRRWRVTPEQFEQQLRFLRDAGYY